MATIRKFLDKKKVTETEMEGLFIRSLTMGELEELVESRKVMSSIKTPETANKLTLQLLSLACDANGESFEEFASYEAFKDSVHFHEFTPIVQAINNALMPGEKSAKK